jgi:hypothetical protein
VLQVTVFLFIRLPRKLAVKSKRIILKRFHKRSRKRRHGGNNNNNSDDNDVVVIQRDVNECFWMEFEDPPERSNPLQPEMQEFSASHRSGRVLFLGSEEGNVEMDAWIAQEMEFVFGERNTWLGDDHEEAWREMLERGTFWFGSFWANGDHLGSAPEFNGGGQWRRGEERDEIEIYSPRF